MNRSTLKSKGINLAWCIIGNIIIGMGVAFAKIAAFGNDPFNGSCMAVSAFFSLPYTTYTLCYNTFLFLFELLFGRKHIGVGTFINWFLLCFAADFFIGVFGGWFAGLSGIGFRLLFLALGVIACGLGLAIYQECDAGVAPYDAIPLMICDRFPRLKFFWVRIALDSVSVLMMLGFGGIVGIGTLITALGLGPVIHFFEFLIRKARKASANA